NAENSSHSLLKYVYVKGNIWPLLKTVVYVLSSCASSQVKSIYLSLPSVLERYTFQAWGSFVSNFINLSVFSSYLYLNIDIGYQTGDVFRYKYDEKT
ncbi:hypothetical protein, partial [Mycoplasmopsis bovis]|uniref:hypothetical protein n=1 Tax=Mycoplasmopsis bovis TaxID=28903 RepID=UPI003D2D5683